MAMRSEFILPTNRAISAVDVAQEKLDQSCTYLCGNSLGALPKQAAALVQEELDVWGSRAVEGHFNHPHGRSWMDMTDLVNPLLAELVGAREHEVACMGGLTGNLHLMMNSFYKPTRTRFKILCEEKAFPSDQYAFASQAALHGFDPKDTVVALAPRPGEYTLRESDILKIIEREGASIALVLFPGVQYYTGQWFPMQNITKAAKVQGCICGWDLAHAIGNVPMHLHDWDVDFAVWCSYKYLNAGPGAIAGLFIHEKWADSEKPKLAGWWGHDPSTRFTMPPTFSPIRGAQGFAQSNPAILPLAALLGSLRVFKQAGMMDAIRERSLRLTGLLETRLKQSKSYVATEDVFGRYGSSAAFGAVKGEIEVDRNDGEVVTIGEGTELLPGFTIITPAEPSARGAQLSLLFLPTGRGLMTRVFAGLKRFGVVGDEREPDVIRLAPVALYNTEEDVEYAAGILERIFEELSE